jgi:hypothetical protein
MTTQIIAQTKVLKDQSQVIVVNHTKEFKQRRDRIHSEKTSC